MKRTFTANIAGYAFTIDEDAFRLLYNYLETIGNAFAKDDDGKEVAFDIEMRISELLLERSEKGRLIVSYDDIEAVIAQIGEPEEIFELEIEENCSDSGFATPPPYNPEPPVIKKRLFRDPDNMLLGGVCSGVACYFGVDVTVVRLLTVLLIFLSASTVVIAYLIMWIIVPVADTPLKKMQMYGESPTLSNIGKIFREKKFRFYGRNEIKEGNMESGGSSFGRTLMKILLILVSLICLPVFLIVIYVMIVCFAALFGAVGDVYTDLNREMGLNSIFIFDSVPFYGLALGAGVIIVLSVPLFLLTRYIVGRKSFSSGLWIGSVVIWIIGVFLTVCPILALVQSAQKLNDYAAAEPAVTETTIETVRTDSISSTEIEVTDSIN